MSKCEPIHTSLTEAARTSYTSKEEVLDLLKVIGEAVSATLGEWCEIVVHDLADLEHSIVWISGDVTGRSVGGPMTDLGLANLRAGQTEPHLNYRSYTDDGKTLKSTSVFIHDEKGNPVASLCINLDITPALLFDHFLGALVSDSEAAEVTESFSKDFREMVEALVGECAYRVGKPISVMTKGDRMKVVELLDERGVFQLRKSIPLVGKRLGVSSKTIYNYLAELEGEKESSPTASVGQLPRPSPAG